MSDVEVLSQIGKSKIQMMKDDPLRFFTRAVLAGLYLGIAAIISYTLGALFSDNTAVSKVMVAGSFGIGLVAIIFLGAELFTGNCYVTMMPVIKGDIKLRGIIPAWIACYVGNCVGIGIICWLFIMCGSQSSILKPYLQSLIDAKLDFDVVQLIIRGILCNFIVCIAAYAGVKIKGDTARLIVIMVMVMAFVLPGFEHCIANAGIFTMGISLLGSSINIAMIPLHMLLSTIGNIIGGTFLAVLLYIVFR
ncbi:MAG: formate/nitrite transporter family protein [Erysipelotrichaceae bacterium]|nr:formate/nitrite transporter family protein [Erysipelotrichaceae bacterium]